MQLHKLISAQRTHCADTLNSKKTALKQLSDLLCKDLSNADSQEIFESLVARERIGNTGIGEGVAIPHLRTKSTKEPIAAFLKLPKGIEFEAQDHQPVDLLCALLVPEDANEEHLAILAELASMFNDPQLREQMRKANNDQLLYEIISSQKFPPGNY